MTPEEGKALADQMRLEVKSPRCGRCGEPSTRRITALSGPDDFPCYTTKYRCTTCP